MRRALEDIRVLRRCKGLFFSSIVRGSVVFRKIWRS